MRLDAVWRATLSVALCVAAARLAPCFGADSPLEQAGAAHAQLLTHFAQVSRSMGPGGAADLDTRLQMDLYELTSDQRPDGYPVGDWNERLRNIAALDASIVRQAIVGKSDELAGSRGLVERLFVSRADGTLQPFALYIPATLPANPNLVVLLHGNPQTESEILAAPQFRQLADSSGSIVATPWGRGNYDFAPPGADEVYQVRDAVASAFHINPRRVFLAGYSMGGFSVFKVGPLHGDRWAGILCISGAILNSEASHVVWALRNTPFYVVTGKQDQSIPAQYGELTAAFLAGVGIPTEFVEEPTGTHLVPSLMPSLQTAWADMIAGIIKHPPTQSTDTLTLGTQPMTSDGMRP